VDDVTITTKVSKCYTGVARNFDWQGPKIEKFCNVILVTFFGDVIAIMMP